MSLPLFVPFCENGPYTEKHLSLVNTNFPGSPKSSSPQAQILEMFN